MNFELGMIIYKIMKRFFYNILLLLVTLLSVYSCVSKEGQMTELTHKFFNYYNEESFDSLQMLYPSLELKYSELAFDNIEVTEFKDLGEDLYQVSLVRTFSKNNSLNDVEKSLLTLTYKATEPKDSLAFLYIIINSTGLINPELLPYYVSACGAIKNKKYTDLEYKERCGYAYKIYVNKAAEIAYMIETNARIRGYKNFYNGKAKIGDDNKAYFTIQNNTQYSCTGFNVHLGLKSLGNDEYMGETSAFYGSESAKLLPYSTNRYNMNIPNSIKRNKTWDGRYYYNYVATARVEVPVEAVMNNNVIAFDGTEYDNCIDELKMIEAEEAAEEEESDSIETENV